MLKGVAADLQWRSILVVVGKAGWRLETMQSLGLTLRIEREEEGLLGPESAQPREVTQKSSPWKSWLPG